jgi:hypothetical protein
MMDEEIDKRISQLLSRRAPAERDPLFRIQVLERRERQRFRRSILQLLGAFLAIVVALTIGASTGGNRGTYEVVRVGVFAAAAAIAISVYIPLFTRLLRASLGRLSSN